METLNLYKEIKEWAGIIILGITAYFIWREIRNQTKIALFEKRVKWLENFESITHKHIQEYNNASHTFLGEAMGRIRKEPLNNVAIPNANVAIPIAGDIKSADAAMLFPKISNDIDKFWINLNNSYCNFCINSSQIQTQEQHGKEIERLKNISEQNAKDFKDILSKIKKESKIIGA